MSDLTNEIQIIHIPLARIDLADVRYRISREDEDISALAQSIKQTGLTSLPLVRPSREPKQPREPRESVESYIVVSGFKRINALVRNGYSGMVVCETYPNVSEEDCAVHAISSNAFQRLLTPGELIQSILLLSRFMEVEIMAKKSLGIFNTQFSTGYIKDLQKIGTLPPKVRELLDDGQLSIKSAKKISEEPSELADCFVALFSAVKASASKQMEIITNFVEIAARENINPADLYRENKIQTILEHDNKDLGFKGNLLRTYLTERRFPSLEKKRREIRQKINSLKLGSGIKVIVPANFESMTYSISLDFKTLDEFTTRVACLEGLSSNPALEEILKR